MRISRGYHRAPVPRGPENSFLQMGQLCQFYQTFPFHGILSFRNLDNLDPLEFFFKTISRPVQPKLQEAKQWAYSFTRCLRSTKELNQLIALYRGHNSSASRNACDHKLSWKSAKDWPQRVIVQTNGASICPHPAFNERAAIGEGSEWGMEPNHRITRDTSRYKPTLGCLWPITNTMQYKCAVCDQSLHSWTIARPDKIVGDSRTDFSWNYWGTLVMANLYPLSNVHKVSVTNQRSPFGMQQL